MSKTFAAEFFDSSLYLKNNPDVLAAIIRGDFTNAYDHFQKYGQVESRAPNAMFDAKAYLIENPDVLAAVQKGYFKSAWDHFTEFGVKEGRKIGSMAGTFDEKAYLSANADVAAAVKSGALVSGYQHFLVHGKGEGRAAFTTDGKSMVAGNTFALTSGKDTLTGTSAGDTFTADGYNPQTSATETQLNALDSIDGGAGKDTLDIRVVGTDNATLTGTVKNVEVIQIDNTAATAAAAHSGGAVDVSKFGGASELWQISKAAIVNKLASGVTAGFREVTGASTLTVNNASDVTASKVALDNVTGGRALAIGGDKLAAVTVSGTLADGTGALALNATVGTDVQAVTVTSSVQTTLTVIDSASTKKVTSVDASASTGKITFVGDSDTTKILGGSGDDTLTLATATSSTVSAELTAGAGKDTVTINTTGNGNTTVSLGAGNDAASISTAGTGTTTVTAGDGDDVVSILARNSGKLSVDLGAGNDIFTSSVAIKGTDVIDAGAGSDTLALKLVGSSNIGAFKNFDVFDVAALAKTLDVAILSTNNAVSEFVGSATSGSGAVLQNMGDGVGFRATGSMGTTNTLSLTQKTAGSLTVTLDADEVGPANTSIDTASMKIDATNAKALKAVFDTSYLASIDGETSSGDNASTITLSGVAESLAVVSGGTNAANTLNYSGNAVTAVTVSGASALDLNVTSTGLASVDASAMTGKLTFDLADLKNGGSLSLGAGKDTVTVTNASTTNAMESISGLSADDHLVLASAAVVADADGNGTVAIKDGVLTFEGEGPSTFADAVAAVNTAVSGTGDSVVFQYLSDSYFFSQGSTDTLVKLTGLTGATSLTEGTSALADHFTIA